MTTRIREMEAVTELRELRLRVMELETHVNTYARHAFNTCQITRFICMFRTKFWAISCGVRTRRSRI